MLFRDEISTEIEHNFSRITHNFISQIEPQIRSVFATNKRISTNVGHAVDYTDEASKLLLPLPHTWNHDFGL